MKKIIMAMLICTLLYGCASDKYSQKDNPLSLEVNLSKEEADKKILENILLNDAELKDTTLLKLKYDENKLKSLNIFEVIVNNDDEKEVTKFKVKVQDTTKPEIKFDKTEVEYGTDILDLIKVSDNFDDEKILKNTLKIKGYNSKKSGKQDIVITVEDSSKNKTDLKVKLTVKDEVKEEASNTNNQISSNNQPTSNTTTNTTTATSNNNAQSSGSNSSASSSNNDWDDEIWNNVVPEPEPQYACPTVPHHMEGNVEVWEGDPNLPCDFTPNTVGNGGLYDSMEETENAINSLGFTIVQCPIKNVNYNDGTVKYTFSY